MSERIRIHLAPDEILTTRPTITIDVPRDADERLIPRAIAVRGVDARVSRARKAGRYRWTPKDDLPPGRHTLVVGGLTDAKSRRLSESIEVDFIVVASRATLPEHLRVESFTRVRLHRRGNERLSTTTLPRGKYIDFVKAAERRSGKPIDLAFDQDGNEVDGQALLAEQQEVAAEKLAKVHPSLDKAIRAAGKEDSVLVDVWFDIDEGHPTSADRPLNRSEVNTAGRRARELRQQLRQRISDTAKQLGIEYEIVAADAAAPVVTLDVPVERIRQLADRDEVAMLYLHEVEGIDDLDTSIAVARSNLVHTAGIEGSGVRVAVWESGPSSNGDLVIAGRFSTSPATSDHSQNVHAIIRNNEAGTPDGHAPACSLYSANSKARAALTWAVDERECTVINQSFHRSSEPHSGVLSSDDVYGDWLALHWPYPLITHAAGNFWDGDDDAVDPPSSEYVNHKGYNTISVGNHNDDASAMDAGSVFRNPTSPHGDRELPEISANGTDVTADGITMTGTSQASPAVAGAVALIQETDATLEHWPEGCRAILLTSADRNVRDDTWWQDNVDDIDARDGAGAVNASAARSVALNRRWRNAPATGKGWDIGLLDSSDFGSDRLSTFDYAVRMPRHWPLAARNAKVALAWTSKVGSSLDATYTSSLTVDLDLKVFDSDGAQVAYSGSWDNSYEIAEWSGIPGATYTIKIRRWSGTDPTYFGIAWSTTGWIILPIDWAEVLAEVVQGPLASYQQT